MNFLCSVLRQMHIVTYDTEKYNNLGEAVGKDGGIAVIGVFFKVWCRHLGNETVLHGYGGAIWGMNLNYADIVLLPSGSIHKLFIVQQCCDISGRACCMEKSHLRKCCDYCQNNY